MNGQSNNSYQELDERMKALQTNTSAINAIASAIEGTLGPKGLDTMLVDTSGQVVITNDGVTILNKMEVNHPAAKMLIQVARAQQNEIGDGTTTATILSSELLNEAVNQINKGVPVPKIIAGVKKGIELAQQIIQQQSRSLDADDKEILYRIAYVAGREHEDIAELIVEAATLIGNEKLIDPSYKFSDSVIAHEGSDNELINGLILNKRRMNPQMPNRIETPKLLVIEDAFGPEEIDDEAMGTELGFSKYLEYKEAFKRNLNKISELGVNVIAVDRGVDPLAEEYCVDNNIMIIQRLSSNDVKRITENTAAKSIKRTGLNKNIDELKGFLGYAGVVVEDEKLHKVRVVEGKGKPVATLIVGASTEEIVEERERIAKDAAASVQAAIRGGYLPGGGAIELFVATELERYKDQFRGLEGFGLQAVINALRKPMAQIVLNAGFNPLEKIEEARLAQIEQQKDSLGIDTDTGLVVNMEAIGVIDPSLVKAHALKVAGEIAEAILRIHTIIRMKKADDEDE